MSAAHFVVRKSTLDKRWDAFYSAPEIVALEHRVQQKATHTLRDFVQFMSGGATPLKSEGDQHYTDAAIGVPFIRVQNLTATGELDLQDVKHITHSTNNSSLARSRLCGGELLVKITGVGRMAVASVVPDGLEANINQHIAAITTESKAQSEALAAYLNLDFVERLASRRATGGTRPALDYNALLSIPVIDDARIVSIMQDAYAEKKRLEAQAVTLLASIDDYLHAELGIAPPLKPASAIDSRIFTVKFSSVLGKRIDPDYNLKYELLFSQQGFYGFTPLNEFLICSPQYGANEEATERLNDNEIRYIRITDIDEFGILKSNNWKTAKATEEIYLLEKNDILFARSGSVGRCYIHKNINQQAIFAGYLIRFKLNTIKINPDFLFYYCHSAIYKFWVSAIQRPGVQANINAEEYKSLPVPYPPLEIQNEITDRISSIRAQANNLLKQAETQLESAKQSVEKIILGEA